MAVTRSQLLHPDSDGDRINDSRAEGHEANNQRNRNQVANGGNDESPLRQVTIHPSRPDKPSTGNKDARVRELLENMRTLMTKSADGMSCRYYRVGMGKATG